MPSHCSNREASISALLNSAPRNELHRYSLTVKFKKKRKKNKFHVKEKDKKEAQKEEKKLQEKRREEKKSSSSSSSSSCEDKSCYVTWHTLQGCIVAGYLSDNNHITPAALSIVIDARPWALSKPPER